jgi:hypothetical protein
MLLHGRAPDAADLLAQAWPVVDPFLQPAPNEREYVDRPCRGSVARTVRAKHPWLSTRRG